MRFCSTCSMPLEDKNFIGLRNANNIFCTYCIDENKNIKSCEDIFEGGVQYFMNAENASRAYAEKIVRKNMNMLPYWKNYPSACLQGEMLTDEEFHNLFCKQKQ